MLTSAARNSKPKSALISSMRSDTRSYAADNGEIEEKLDLTKNQAPSQVDAVCGDDNEVKNSETQNISETVRHKRRTQMRV
jgi:hypothetical protein